MGDLGLGERAFIDGERVDDAAEAVGVFLVGADAQGHALGGGEDLVLGRGEGGDAPAVDVERGDFVGRAEHAHDVGGAVRGQRLGRVADERGGGAVFDPAVLAHEQARAEQGGGAEGVHDQRAGRAVGGGREP